MGGRQSWFAAASGHDLAGAVGFYGRPGESNGVPGPTQRAAEIAAPILALQAGDDANITAEDNAAFDAALAEAGVEHEVVTYAGAPHSFFDRKQEQFLDASNDAWGQGARVRRALFGLIGRGGRTVRRGPLGREERLVDLPVEDRDVVLDAEPQDILALDAVLGRDLLGCEVVRHGTRSVRPSCAVWEPARGRADGPRRCRR